MKDGRWDKGSLERLDRLIAKGKGVRGMPGRVHTLFEDAFEEWRISSLDFIQEELSGGSQYYKDFATRVFEASLSSCNAGIGILTALRESLEKSHPKGGELPSTVKEGLQEGPKEERSSAGVEGVQQAGEPRLGTEEMPKKWPNKEELCGVEPSPSREVLEGILWQAEVQLSQGHKDAAAVLCGAVLEEALRWMCTKHDIPTKEWDTIGDLNDRLMNKGVYHESMHSKIVSWWYLREDAQSANFDAYGEKDVATMIKGVQDFPKNYFSTTATRNPGDEGREV
ncbi:MAG: hypothetical protein ACE5IC_06505 [Candidatus Brocadiales bacterium]